jgi:ATP-dependent exoDNAse (exonuclease V) beta subunit
MIDKVIEGLSRFDSDVNFTFDKEIRRYTYNNKPLLSVSNFIKSLHKEFDSDYWSKVKAEQLGITQEEILAQWDAKAKRSTEIGNFVHKWIENYYNKIWTELPVDLEIIDRINSFNQVFGKHLHKLTPICFEKRVFSEKYGIVGIIDSIFLYKDKPIIVDFKTNATISTENRFQKMFAPFDSYDDCNFIHYSIQVSLYSLILKELGIDIICGYLLHISEEGANLIKCLDLSSVIEEFILGKKPINS